MGFRPRGNLRLLFRILVAQKLGRKFCSRPKFSATRIQKKARSGRSLTCRCSMSLLRFLVCVHIVSLYLKNVSAADVSGANVQVENMSVVVEGREDVDFDLTGLYPNLV